MTAWVVDHNCLLGGHCFVWRISWTSFESERQQERGESEREREETEEES